MPRLDEIDFWVDDLYDMTESQLQDEADHYARLARHGPHAENKAYRFAYHRHQAATELLRKIRAGR
jgi:hypothetical protein